MTGASGKADLLGALPATVLGVVIVLGFFFENYQSTERSEQMLARNKVVLDEIKAISIHMDEMTVLNRERGLDFITFYKATIDRLEDKLDACAQIAR